MDFSGGSLLFYGFSGGSLLFYGFSGGSLLFYGFSGGSLLLILKSLFLLYNSVYPQKNNTIICAVNILRNIASGYTVEYPTAGASFEQMLFEYANAGGSV